MCAPCDTEGNRGARAEMSNEAHIHIYAIVHWLNSEARLNRGVTVRITDAQATTISQWLIRHALYAVSGASPYPPCPMCHLSTKDPSILQPGNCASRRSSPVYDGRRGSLPDRSRIAAGPSGHTGSGRRTRMRVCARRRYVCAHISDIKSANHVGSRSRRSD